MYHISHENSHGIDVTCFAVVAFTYMLQACLTSTETIWRLSNPRNNFHTDGLVQEKRNSSALGIELRLFGTNPLIYWRCRRCVVFCIYIRIYCLNKKWKTMFFLQSNYCISSRAMLPEGQGSILLIETIWIWALIYNNIHCFMWNVTTHTCPEFNCGSTWPSLMWGLESYHITYIHMDVITWPYFNPVLF